MIETTLLALAFLMIPVVALVDRYRGSGDTKLGTQLKRVMWSVSLGVTAGLASGDPMNALAVTSGSQLWFYSTGYGDHGVMSDYHDLLGDGKLGFWDTNRHNVENASWVLHSLVGYKDRWSLKTKIKYHFIAMTLVGAFWSLLTGLGVFLVGFPMEGLLIALVGPLSHSGAYLIANRYWQSLPTINLGSLRIRELEWAEVFRGGLLALLMVLVFA
jgi:hypothetical protein